MTKVDIHCSFGEQGETFNVNSSKRVEEEKMASSAIVLEACSAFLACNLNRNSRRQVDPSIRLALRRSLISAYSLNRPSREGGTGSIVKSQI